MSNHTPRLPLAQHPNITKPKAKYYRRPTSEIVAAIKEAEGDLSLAARMLGMTRNGIYKRARASNEIADAIEIARAIRGRRMSVKSAWLEGVPKNAADAKQRYLYLVQEQWQGWVKIGVATSLYSRLSVLRSSMPQEVILLGYFVLRNAESFEQHLHQTFRHLRGNGEWFRLSNDDLLELVSMQDGFVKAS